MPDKSNTNLALHNTLSIERQTFFFDPSRFAATKRSHSRHPERAPLPVFRRIREWQKPFQFPKITTCLEILHKPRKRQDQNDKAHGFMVCRANVIRNLAKTPLFPRFLANSRLKYDRHVCARHHCLSGNVLIPYLFRTLRTPCKGSDDTP